MRWDASASLGFHGCERRAEGGREISPRVSDKNLDMAIRLVILWLQTTPDRVLSGRARDPGAGRCAIGVSAF